MTPLLVEIYTRLIQKGHQVLKHPMAIDGLGLVASQYISASITLLISIITARLLGPNEYGRAALVISYPTLIYSLIAIKSSSITTKHIASFKSTGQEEEIKSTCALGYGIDFLASIVTSVIVVISVQWVVWDGYNRSEMNWLMVMYACSLSVLSLSGTSIAVLSAWGRLRWLAVFHILDRTTTLCLMVVLLVSGFGLSGFVIASAVGQVTMGLLTMVAATHVLRRDGVGSWWKTSLQKVTPLLSELGASLSWNYVAVTLSGIITHVPVVLLGHLRTPEEAGF
jgi:O-antigen/teichoic acid export membrane protein